MEHAKWKRYLNHFLECAQSAARLSHCAIKQVGAIAVRNNRIILEGFNGMPPNSDNCCEEQIYQDDGFVNYTLKTKPEVIHAEMNLIYHAAAEGISLKGVSIFCTDEPCLQCAKALHSVGVSQVYYMRDHDDGEGSIYLKKQGIPCYLVTIKT